MELKSKYEKAMNDEKNKVSRKTEVTKNLANVKLLKKAKAKALRELEKATKKHSGKKEDSDSEKVEDLVKRVKEAKKRKEIVSGKKDKEAAKQAANSEDEGVQAKKGGKKRSVSKSPKATGRKTAAETKANQSKVSKTQSKSKSPAPK